MSGVFTRLKAALTRTKQNLGDNLTESLGESLVGNLKKILKSGAQLTPAQKQMLEDLLIAADMGLAQARAISASLTEDAPFESEKDLRQALAIAIARILSPYAKPLSLPRTATPAIILVAGVNGTGKTTSIGKLAHYYKAQGKTILLAACDTYRAAAAEQLQIWARRLDVPIIVGAEQSDAAALAYQAIEAAQAQNIDIVLIDTAGRLQNNQDLMAELEKICRVIQKLDDTAPHASLLVIDATTGQNALTQAQAFMAAADLTGLIITKLDSSARGGMIVPIASTCQLPVHFIGVGEAVEDLQIFDAAIFAAALTASESESDSKSDNEVAVIRAAIAQTGEIEAD
ncbi:MAG: signal recognition particle-docking protein FtsY [Alphaproteobacteria bacterium]|nr:signal recognition particle-docking protein FtsY [Alphaproteobacteria bacterium]